ncbi:hypothetical protein BV25DRAFT_1827099 [Artomyces pyxidatus]|uniref:Uncharacterized protein n=1 Tax=Artomyces pyxidatus TaxID=48021 RepID=A0ACB8SZG6_9AGAM|nr:hypothetical protein BV25DRAFT_1827099 [Artomyces pyxidatus]
MDDFGIVYLIENAQQFWSEVEDTLRIPTNASLSILDATLKRFVTLCASYHEQFLQSPLQLEHACDLLHESELFTFHSERMCEILTDQAIANTDPHAQLILYNVLLLHGRRNGSFLRSQKRWQPLLPLLMDHVLVTVDPDIEDTYTGSASGPSTGWKGSVIPIEAKLRSLSIRMLYEVCRASKLTIQELKVFSDEFIDHLFELVEQTRNMHDETFNYSVIKLIVALNEQFMVAALKVQEPHKGQGHKPAPENRVLQVLKRRHGASQTFGENMIFMLNRAGRSPEDLVMQLLVLKILYILFTTKEMCEYFYTNDLCVLVDVFLREIVDLDEDSESLRHTYLRVLHPLLTKTQLRNLPYKRPAILRALESLVENPEIREVSVTTKRLVDRCLSGEWCVHLRKPGGVAHLAPEAELHRTASPSTEQVAHQDITPTSSTTALNTGLTRQRSLKVSRSVEDLRSAATQEEPARAIEVHLHAGTDNVLSLPGIASTLRRDPSTKRRQRQSSFRLDHQPQYTHREILPPVRANSVGTTLDNVPQSHVTSFATSVSLLPKEPLSPSSITSVDSRLSISSPTPASASPSSSEFAPVGSNASSPSKKPAESKRRTAPAPPKRRKPPAVPVPVGTSNSGAKIAAIASSTGRSARTGA